MEHNSLLFQGLGEGSTGTKSQQKISTEKFTITPNIARNNKNNRNSLPDACNHWCPTSLITLRTTFYPPLLHQPKSAKH